MAVGVCRFVLVSSLVSWSMFTCGKEGKHVGARASGHGVAGAGGQQAREDWHVGQWKAHWIPNTEPGVSRVDHQRAFQLWACPHL